MTKYNILNLEFDILNALPRKFKFKRQMFLVGTFLEFYKKYKVWFYGKQTTKGNIFVIVQANKLYG